MSNEPNITNRRFNFNKNSKHIVSNSQNFLDKPINMNVQNINNNEINYNNDNNENNNKDNQRKLPKIINSIDGKGRNPYYFNKTSGIIGFRKGISFNSLKESSDNNLKYKRIKIIDKKNFQEKKDLIEENNDSFIDELTDILNDVNNNNKNSNQIILEDSKDNQNNSIKDDDDDDDKNKSEEDREPDPRINFEHINQLNQKRPQTSYGGLNTRRKNLQTALKGKQNLNQPNFTNYFNFPNFNHNINK